MTTDLESRVAAALATRARGARPEHRLDAVRAGTAHVRSRRGTHFDPGLTAAHRHADWPMDGRRDDLPVTRSTHRLPMRHWWVPIGAAASIAVGAAGVVALRSGSGGGWDGPGWGAPSGVPATTPPTVRWLTPHISLSAQEITIDLGGRTLTPPATATVESAVVSRREEELQVRWQEQGVDVRWTLTFKMDDRGWWVDQMRVEEALAPSPTGQVTFDDDGTRVPLGTPVGGDIDVAVERSNPIDSDSVRVSGLRLLAFRDRVTLTGPEAEPAPVAEAPPAPPLPDDVRPVGLYGTDAEWMATLVAKDELTRECMAAAGVDYPRIPDDAIARRLDGRGRAAADGFHQRDDEPLLNGGAHGIPDSLSADAEDAYYKAMGAGTDDGCLAHATSAMGGEQDLSPMRGWDAVIGISGLPIEEVHAQAYGKPEVAAALVAWGRCMVEAVGERAANPSELARMYGTDGSGSASAHEKDVAVADFDCQQQVDWDTVWDTAVVERERAAMGDRVGEYDQWVRDYQAMIATARQVLDDRGIVIPGLD